MRTGSLPKGSVPLLLGIAGIRHEERKILREDNEKEQGGDSRAGAAEKDL